MGILKITDSKTGDAIYYGDKDQETIETLLKEYFMSMRTLFLVLKNKFYISVIFSEGNKNEGLDIVLDFIFSSLQLKNRKLLGILESTGWVKNGKKTQKWIDEGIIYLPSIEYMFAEVIEKIRNSQKAKENKSMNIGKKLSEQLGEILENVQKK